MLKRSPGVVAYWRDHRLVVENYLTKRRLLAGRRTLEVLSRLGQWRSLRAVLNSFPAAQRPAARRLIQKLVTLSFLETSTHRGRSLGAWHSWHPTASFFHFATKNVPFARSASGKSSVDRDLGRRVTKRPTPVKRYRGRPVVALPPPFVDGEFPRALLGRRTWRRFGASPIDRGELSTLLGLTFGAQHRVTLSVVGTIFLTTSPSGGSRHPIEPYVIVQRVRGVRAGVYHYEKDRHRLVRIRGARPRSVIAKFFPGQGWYARAPVIVIMTALFERTQWKYPHPHAYRVVLAEAGHVCQTFCLTASWLGLAPFCTMALSDATIEQTIGIDGVGESVIYAAGVGTKPADATWAPWPDARMRVPRLQPIGRR